MGHAIGTVGLSGTSTNAFHDSFSHNVGHQKAIDEVLYAARQAFPEVLFNAAMLQAHQTRLAEAEREASKTTESAHLTPFEGTEPGVPEPQAEPLAQDAAQDSGLVTDPPVAMGMPDVAWAADWALAAACSAGVQEAVAAVERGPLRNVPAFIRRIDVSTTFRDELMQTLRERLFVAPTAGGVPRIASYSGRGPMEAWIRVIAVRLALEMKRRETVQPPESAADRLVELALGPEDQAAQNEHAEAAQVALRVALKTLTPRQRNLLRLRFAEGWSPEDLGQTYGVHRATIARWVQEAREHVKAAMGRELARILGFSEDEMPSVLRAVESRLELTFSMLKA